MREDERLRYASFVSARYPSLLRTAYLLTGDPDSAQDLVESALVEVYLSWARTEVRDRPDARATWVLAHRFVSSRRRWRREVSRDHRSGPVATTWRDGREGRVVEARTVWEQLGRLTARQRAVVVLRYHENLSEREVAEDLGIRPGTVQDHERAALRLWQPSGLTGQPSRSSESRPQVGHLGAPSRYERP